MVDKIGAVFRIVICVFGWLCLIFSIVVTIVLITTFDPVVDGPNVGLAVGIQVFMYLFSFLMIWITGTRVEVTDGVVCQISMIGKCRVFHLKDVESFLQNGKTVRLYDRQEKMICQYSTWTSGGRKLTELLKADPDKKDKQPEEETEESGPESGGKINQPVKLGKSQLYKLMAVMIGYGIVFVFAVAVLPDGWPKIGGMFLLIMCPSLVSIVYFRIVGSRIGLGRESLLLTGSDSRCRQLLRWGNGYVLRCVSDENGRLDKGKLVKKGSGFHIDDGDRVFQHLTSVTYDLGENPKSGKKIILTDGQAGTLEFSPRLEVNPKKLRSFFPQVRNMTFLPADPEGAIPEWELALYPCLRWGILAANVLAVFLTAAVIYYDLWSLGVLSLVFLLYPGFLFACYLLFPRTVSLRMGKIYLSGQDIQKIGIAAPLAGCLFVQLLLVFSSNRTVLTIGKFWLVSILIGVVLTLLLIVRTGEYRYARLEVGLVFLFLVLSYAPVGLFVTAGYFPLDTKVYQSELLSRTKSGGDDPDYSYLVYLPEGGTKKLGGCQHVYDLKRVGETVKVKIETGFLGISMGTVVHPR